MKRAIVSVAVLSVIGVLLAGCTNTTKQTSTSPTKSSWFGESNWGPERPYGNAEGTSMWYSGMNEPSQWGAGIKDLGDARTYDANVGAAVNDLTYGKLATTREFAAMRLGDLGSQADVTVAIDALGRGTKDPSMQVRFASADALQRIGSPKAMFRLKLSQQHGYIPSGTINYVPTAMPTSSATTRPSSAYSGGATTRPGNAFVGEKANNTSSGQPKYEMDLSGEDK